MNAKKLDSLLKKDSKKLRCDEDGFIRGGAQVRHYYDTGLIKIFGRKLGILVSNYLLKAGAK